MQRNNVSAACLITGALKTLSPDALKGAVVAAGKTISGNKGYIALMAFFAAIVYGSTVIALDGVRQGYHNVYGVTREIPWGILISTYIFFVVTSTGLCIVSSIGHVFGIKAFMPIAKRAVFLSIVTIMSGFVAILLEIENPFKMMIYNALSPNLTSNIWWMGTLYGAYMAFMIFEYAFLVMDWHKPATMCGLAGLLSGIAAHSNLGAIFGMLHGREFWYGPYMPIYFIVSAMMSGCAAIIMFTWLGYTLNGKKMEQEMLDSLGSVSKLAVLLIATIMFFTTWKLITGMVGGEGKQATIAAFLSGPYTINFWAFEVMIGMVIPFFLMLASRGKDMVMMVMASMMMMLGIFVMRFDLVVFGQIVSVFHELAVTEYMELQAYTPSFHELGVVVGALSVCALAFLLGERVFDGHKSTDHH